MKRALADKRAVVSHAAVAIMTQESQTHFGNVLELGGGPMDFVRSSDDTRFVTPVHVGAPNMGSRDAFQALVDEIFDNRWLSNDGPILQRFEEAIKERLGVRHCVAMTNGTVALEIATRALGLTGEVIVPSFSFVATAHALSWQGLTPVFADIDPSTQTIDPGSVERMITPRTSGIVGVHLWGRPADVAGLQKVADRHGIALMFDAAHAFNVSRNGLMVGHHGQAEVFSFHATKFLNSFEGGAVVTNDDALADKMQLMRNFGFYGLDNVIHPGTNGKMTEICAAMGLVNLSAVDSFVVANKANHAVYREAFESSPDLELLEYDELEVCNYQYAVVTLTRGDRRTRDRLVEQLRERNILARRYFWPGIHRMQPYRSLQPHAGLLLPNTVDVSERVIVLPTGSAVSTASAQSIAETVLYLLESIG